MHELITRADAFYRYKQATGGVPDEMTGLLKIDLSQYRHLEPLAFTSEGRTFWCTANAQIWPRSLNTIIGGFSDGIYLIVADLNSPSGKGLDFVLGLTFLERFYAVYDSSDGSVSLATTPYTSAITNWWDDLVWRADMSSDM